MSVTVTVSLRDYLERVRKEWETGVATEESYRPALKALLESGDGRFLAITEPRRIACGAPDFVVQRSGNTIGYAETKDLGADLDAALQTEQLQRYLENLPNLLVTNYLEFRWFVDGQERQRARWGWLTADGQLVWDEAGMAQVSELLTAFLSHEPIRVGTPDELAHRMAQLTRMLRRVAENALAQSPPSRLLTELRDDLARVLMPVPFEQMTEEQRQRWQSLFADMFAQTIAYGLFAARVHFGGRGQDFNRFTAASTIPPTTPLLRRLFHELTSPDIESEPFIGFVDDLVQLLANADFATTLENFGKRRTGREDPTLHFYETFLAAYDPTLRERRGVYYTPEPVVYFIVRSVDWLLRERFRLPDGLADTEKVEVTSDGKTEMRPRVLVLDPACGTGTFLYAVVDLVRERFRQRRQEGMWRSFVREHLLPRLFGFELLIAPYTVAHLKLSLQLTGYDLSEGERANLSYSFQPGERLHIYLTNTLEEPERQVPQLTGLLRALSDEVQEANRIKAQLPILIVLGNPPYAGAPTEIANEDTWGERLVRQAYYRLGDQPLEERNPKVLLDDYVKFIRFGQWRIERTGRGILAFITNHGYLDNPTFRGMRFSLLQTFDEIYLLNLHGNQRKREQAPDGRRDENIFDIQQGVCIGIFVKLPASAQSSPSEPTSHARVFYADLWGRREEKLNWLLENELATTQWQEWKPQPPFFTFRPEPVQLRQIYDQWWRLTDIFPVYSVGIVTSRDSFVFAFTRDELERRIQEFLNPRLTDDQARQRFLRPTDKLNVATVRETLRKENWRDCLIPCLYRPFDVRFLLYHTAVIERCRNEVMQHMLGKENIALLFVRQMTAPVFEHALVTRFPAEYKACSHDRNTYLAPLYLYPNDRRVRELFESYPPGKEERRPNLNPAFVEALTERLSLPFDFNASATEGVVTPEDVLHYLYALLHSPTYRTRFAPFLRLDFPRLPLPPDAEAFWELAQLGADLVALHLLDDDYPFASWVKAKRPSPLASFPLAFPVAGSDKIERVRYDEKTQRLFINARQFFEGVPPEIWDFRVGGYRVLEKWIAERKGRRLEFDDQRQIARLIKVIGETLRLMAAIDEATQWLTG
jgi:hypothetical protein